MHLAELLPSQLLEAPLLASRNACDFRLGRGDVELMKHCYLLTRHENLRHGVFLTSDDNIEGLGWFVDLPLWHGR